MYAIELLILYNSIYHYFQMTYRKNNTQTYLNMDSDEILDNIGFYFKYILNQSVIYYHIFIITSLFILFGFCIVSY